MARFDSYRVRGGVTLFKRIGSLFLLAAILVSLHGTFAVYFLIGLHTGDSWRFSKNDTLLHDRQMTASWPVTLPYQPDQEDFVPAMGFFEQDKIHYRIIKQRYSRDTLYIVYAIDIQKNRLGFLYDKLLKGQNVSGGVGHGLISCLKILPGAFVVTEFLCAPDISHAAYHGELPTVLLLFKSHQTEKDAPPPKA